MTMDYYVECSKEVAWAFRHQVEQPNALVAWGSDGYWGHLTSEEVEWLRTRGATATATDRSPWDSDDK